MPELRNCPECGRVFAYTGLRNLCPQCIEEEEKKFVKVRQYLRDHSGASVFEVAEATGVKEEVILRFLREGRLKTKNLSQEVALECARCGKRILSGKYCADCLAELTKDFKRAQAEEDKKEKPAADIKRRSRERWHLTDR